MRGLGFLVSRSSKQASSPCLLERKYEPILVPSPLPLCSLSFPREQRNRPQDLRRSLVAGCTTGSVRLGYPPMRRSSQPLLLGLLLFPTKKPIEKYGQCEDVLEPT